ncbi:MAG: hypothetical protein IPO91_03785 [Chloroflexi bacterium]|nr:hypothetical protein [Chloroflexota bacterium]
MEARDKAVQMVGYFERVARERPDMPVWAKGRKTAQEWLRLIDAQSVSELELTAFVGVICVHQAHTIGWSDLANEAYQWAQTQGFALPSIEEFYEPENPRALKGLTFLERANKFVDLLTRNTRVDPEYEPWRKELALAEQWLRLMQSENLSEEMTISFFAEVLQGMSKYIDNLWSQFAISVFPWAGGLEYADQLREMIRTMD